jgi:hypothetical protein
MPLALKALNADTNRGYRSTAGDARVAPLPVARRQFRWTCFFPSLVQTHPGFPLLGVGIGSKTQCQNRDGNCRSQMLHSQILSVSHSEKSRAQVYAVGHKKDGNKQAGRSNDRYLD